MIKAILLVAALVCVASANLVHFEVARTTEHDTASWQPLKRAPKQAVFQWRVNLKQRNLDILESTLLDVSDPDSPNYGKWWSKEQVSALVSPPSFVRKTVVSHLMRAGATEATDNGDWIAVTSTVAVAEKMLKTSLHLAQHADKKDAPPAIKCFEGFKLPSHIARHVRSVGGAFAVLQPVKPLGVSISSDRAVPSTVVPQTLETQYNIQNIAVSESSITQAVAEFSNDNSYSPQDLSMFSEQMKVAITDKVITHGPFNPSPPDAESTLDIQYIASTGRNAQSVFWVVSGWLQEWLQDLSNESKPAEIHSISWGADERQEGRSFNNQVDVEFQKLGLRGITFLAASGDSGAPGGGCRGRHLFNPGYPAASPWLLAVGATMYDQTDTSSPINTPYCRSGPSPACANSGHEVPAMVGNGEFASGGGFSVYEAQPEYQKAAVQQYLSSSSVKLPPSSSFNSTARGFPDVGAMGWNLIIALQGEFTPIGGTSASSPIFAGMLALLNNARVKAGKSTLGFVNPLIYKMAADNSGIFKSIGDASTNNNNGCPNGFQSNPNGWDPVTGLGVIDLTKALAYVNNLN